MIWLSVSLFFLFIVLLCKKFFWSDGNKFFESESVRNFKYLNDIDKIKNYSVYKKRYFTTKGLCLVKRNNKRIFIKQSKLCSLSLFDKE